MSVHYEVRAIVPEIANELRRCDDGGHSPRWVVDEDGGNPLRCCFGRSRRGESLALVSYAPLRRWAWDTGADPGPYDELGPVFLHAEDCGGPVTDGFPDGMRGARRVLRAYSGLGRILRGRYVCSPGREGSQEGRSVIEEELGELYEDPAVAAVHVRAVEFGCFLVETRRCA